MEEIKFNSIYSKYKKQVSFIANDLTKGNNYPKEEMTDFLIFEMWEVVRDYDPTKKSNLKGFLEVRLRQRGIDELRKKENSLFYGMERIEKLKEDSLEREDAATFDIADDFQLEEFIVNKDNLKTDTDKLQLINALKEKADPLTLAIVNEYLSDPNAGPTAISRKLGIRHHSKVTRLLRQLSKEYDELQFGKLENYLTA